MLVTLDLASACRTPSERLGCVMSGQGGVCSILMEFYQDSRVPVGGVHSVLQFVSSAVMVSLPDHLLV